MAKSKKKSMSKKRPGRTVAARRAGLDYLALSYARLLADPCAAPLVHPVYPGGDAGFLFRAESIVTYGVASGQTAGVFHWVPGYPNSDSTHLLSGGTATGTALMSANGANSPGSAFLQSNVRGVRCVAACVKVTFPGAESARAGRLHYGHTTAGLIDAAENVIVDNVAQVLQHYTRTPADTVEIVWKPNIADTELNDPSALASPTLRDRKSSITVAWAGLPAAVGLTFHMTAVYEWTPATGLGIGNNATGKNTSTNTMDQVLDYLSQNGFNYIRQAGMSVGSALGAGIINGMARTYGLMAASRNSMSTQRLMN